VTSPRSLLSAVRRRPFVDHLVRTYSRYQADTGDRLAAAVTFYWFLSLFPILLIAVWVTSKSLGADAGRQVTDGLGPYLGKAAATSVGDVVQNSAAKAGVLGVVGLLLTGLGWIQALREAVRTMWHQNVTAGNIVTRKVADVGALVGLFAVIAASVVISGAATTATGSVLGFLGLNGTPGASAFTIVLSYVLGALVDVAVFLYLFVRLAKVPTPVRPVLRGAVFGAVGFVLLKAVGALYVGRTTSRGQATYGTFAVVLGLLVFLNLASRLIMYAAAFVVTAPFDDDVLPSGTATVEQARKSGIPVAYAGTDLNLQEDGAPTPLGPSLQGKVGAMSGETERSWSARKAEPAAAAASASAALVRPPGADKVELAATATAAAGGALLAAVAVYAMRTVRDVLRR
jgi:membrane protein